MAADMTIDIFASTPYGHIALKKIAKSLGQLPENFRLYEAAWLCDIPNETSIMRVTGA